MARIRRVVASLGAFTLALVAFPAFSRAATPADVAVAGDAVAWIVSNQQADGGFEMIGFFGFETRDAALAIAGAAQTGPSWSTAEAVAALAATEHSGTGATPLDALDAFVDAIEPGTAPTAASGNAAKTIYLSARPLGLDPADFDANGDGTGVNLLAFLGEDCDPSIFTFTDRLYGMLAGVTLCGDTPAEAAAIVRAGQQANGGWNFAGDPTGTIFDPDTTALVLEALVATGAGSDDPTIVAALALAAAEQQADGGWIDAFAVESNAGSTSLMVRGIRATGYDPTVPCWRDTVAPSLAGTAYADPVAWMRSQQQPDGHIRSPYDDGFLNTLTTSQAVHAVLANRVPERSAAAQNCVVDSPPPSGSTATPTADAASAVTAVPRFTG
jgi:hypothetical protein